VNPPFTLEQFLGVFADYNVAIWPAQIVAYVLGLIAIAAVWSRWLAPSSIIMSVLALMWAMNGFGYHYLFFVEVNPAAKLFAGFFVLQAILFVASVLMANDLHFKIGGNFRSVAGAAFIIYAMVIYPAFGIWAGHGLMVGPMFGVAPCPTTIFTIGMLLLARGKWMVWLSIIPIIWSLIGLAAALQLGMSEDYGLAVAGAVLLMVLAVEALRDGHGQEPAGPTTGSADARVSQ
jgi:Family of unknown function (DUF6064)